MTLITKHRENKLQVRAISITVRERELQLTALITRHHEDDLQVIDREKTNYK